MSLGSITMGTHNYFRVASLALCLIVPFTASADSDPAQFEEPIIVPDEHIITEEAANGLIASGWQRAKNGRYFKDVDGDGKFDRKSEVRIVPQAKNLRSPKARSKADSDASAATSGESR